MKSITRLSMFDQISGNELTSSPFEAIEIDPGDKMRIYQVRLSPGGVRLIRLLYSMIGPLEIRLPRWVGQNKKEKENE